MKFIKRTLIVIASSFVILASLATFFITTTPGLGILIKVGNIFIPGAIKVKRLDGNILHGFSARKLTYKDGDQKINFAGFRVRFNFENIMRGQVEIKNLVAQTISTNSSEQKLENLELMGIYANNSFSINQLSVSLQKLTLRTSGSIGINAPYPVKLNVKFYRPKDNALKAINGNLQISGYLDNLQWEGKVYGAVSGIIKGSLLNYSRITNKLSLSARDLNLDDGTEIDLEIAKIQTTGTLDNLQNKIDISLIKPFKIKLQTEANISPDKIWTHAKVKLKEGNIEATANIKGDKNKYAYVDIDSSKLLFSDIPPLKNLKVHAKIPFNQKLNNTINIDAIYGGHPLVGRFAVIKEKINGYIKLAGNEMKIDGSTNGVLNITGALNELKILHPELKQFEHSLKITLSKAQINLKKASKDWELLAVLHANNHDLTIKGAGKLEPKLLGSIKISGENFPIIDSKEYYIEASPNLDVNFTENKYEVLGKILIPKATLKPTSFGSTDTLTDDVRYVHANKKPLKKTNAFTARVNVIMGDDVKIDVKGLTGKLVGEVLLTQLPKGEPQAVGELSFIDGKYNAYGQSLVIEEGRLIFAGGLVTNPGLRVRAIRKFKSSPNTQVSSDNIFDMSPSNLQSPSFASNTTVGIEVTGRLKTPKIKLFSSPSGMSQSDILSMLLLGKPANQVGSSGGQLLMSAISGMNLDSGSKGTQLLSQLQSKLGIDVGVNTSSSYDQNSNQVTDTTSLNVGKNITKRIRVSYNTGIFDNNSGVFMISYLLNKFLSIQISTSENGSGLDLNYSHQEN